MGTLAAVVGALAAIAGAVVASSRHAQHQGVGATGLWTSRKAQSADMHSGGWTGPLLCVSDGGPGTPGFARVLCRQVRSSELSVNGLKMADNDGAVLVGRWPLQHLPGVERDRLWTRSRPAWIDCLRESRGR